MKNCDDRYREVYNSTMKRYQLLLAESKKTNIANFVKDSDNKSKAVWSIVNSFKNSTKSSREQVKGDPQQIADSSNKTLINVVMELLKKSTYQEYTCTVNQNIKSMYVRPINNLEIIDIVRNLKNKMTSGYDEIPLHIVKYNI